MSSENAKTRLKIANIMAVLALVVFVFVYFAGPLFPYRGADGSVFVDEDNRSFQPLPMFVPEDARKIEGGEGFKFVLGKSYTDYFPNGVTLYEFEPGNSAKDFIAGAHTLPIWRVALKAPQYPKEAYPEGIVVYFSLTDFEGETTEMNTINHYIGMDPMDVGAFYLRKYVPIIWLALTICLVVYIFYSGPGWVLFGLVPGLIPWFFLGFFTYWLYWFGHTLHPYGQFDVKPFMPTVLGTGKVAQFTTVSYPYVGFYALLLVFLLMTFSILIKRRALREIGQGGMG